MTGEFEEAKNIVDAVGDVAEAVDDGDGFDVNVAAPKQKREREQIVRAGVGIHDDRRVELEL